jgi:CubicO group peptidase (beta-lactamase class C family)
VPGIDDAELRARIGRALNRWPVVGLAVGVVQDGTLAWFHGHGVTDTASQAPVTEDTVFPIASITKTFTAIAVMQLWEQGRVDLDAAADDYLLSFRLVPGRAGFRPATLRHLLTHTAGVRAVRRPSDLLRPAMGWEVPAARPVPPLAEYYRGGLRFDTEPGTRWAYSNHGFATLGRIVEDVGGLPLDRCFRERIFRPLGMESSDLFRSDRVRPRLATGYNLRSGRFRAVADREVVTAGASSVYSTTSDMARYAAALLGGGSTEHGSILRPDTLATMFAPHYQSDPRLPGMGLGFFRGEMGGHRIISHDGILEGFRSDMVLAPDEGIGVLVFANTGPFDPRGVAVPVAQAVLRLLLGVPEEAVPTAVPERPWLWKDLCGWYSFGPGWLTDPQPRMVLGLGLEVAVRAGHLTLRGQIPIPAIRRGLRLYPDEEDPDAFQIDLSALGLDLSPVVFGRDANGEVTALHLSLTPMSLRKRPDRLNPRRWAGGALAAGGLTALAARAARRRPRA